MNAQEQKEEIIKRLEIRKEQLLATENSKTLKYPIHSGHHLRDIITILAYLNGKKDPLVVDALIRTLPTTEDKPF